jgi:hypothetical protein
MNNSNKLKSTSFSPTQFISCKRQIMILMFFLLSTQLHAQQQNSPGIKGIHLGLNSGVLGGGAGPSFSFHYAIRSEKVLQLESMLFFDYHSGTTFLSGGSQKNTGIGVAGGIRINVLPNKNWNPSFAFMPGIMYSSQKTSRYDDADRSGISLALGFSFSNTFYKKHMLSLD